jgi:hypothetical protein
LIPVFLIVGLISIQGCTEEAGVVITSQTLRRESSKISRLPKELAHLGSPAHGYNFWVEGTIENRGSVDVSEITIVFEADDGLQVLTLIADVGELAAGRSASFKTRILPSLYEITLIDDRTSVRFEEES